MGGPILSQNAILTQSPGSPQRRGSLLAPSAWSLGLFDGASLLGQLGHLIVGGGDVAQGLLRDRVIQLLSHAARFVRMFAPIGGVVNLAPGFHQS